MGESEDSCRVCASLLYHTFCHNCDGDVDDKREQDKEVRTWSLACGLLLLGALFYCDLQEQQWGKTDGIDAILEIS